MLSQKSQALRGEQDGSSYGLWGRGGEGGSSRTE